MTTENPNPETVNTFDCEKGSCYITAGSPPVFDALGISKDSGKEQETPTPSV